MNYKFTNTNIQMYTANLNDYTAFEFTVLLLLQVLSVSPVCSVWHSGGGVTAFDGHWQE